MKISIFTENYNRGGLDTFIVTLSNGLFRLGHDICIISNLYHPGNIAYKNLSKSTSSIKLINYNFLTFNKLIESLKIKHGIIAKSLSCIKYPLIFISYLRLLPFFDTIESELLLVVNGGYPASELCRIAPVAWWGKKKRKSILSFHNNAMSPNPITKFIENIIDRCVSNSVYYFITVSQSCAESLKIRTGINREKIIFIYNGIEPTKEELLKDPSQKGDICSILATFEPRKGHLFLIDAFELIAKDLPSAKLYMFGDTSNDNYKNVIRVIKDKKLQNSIEAKGFTDNSFKAINESKIVVVPSQEYESFGLTCIEAMSLKVPVVATNVGGLSEVIINGIGGYSINKDDINGFANAIKKLLENNALVVEIGELGYKRFLKMFTAEKMCNQYNVIINNIAMQKDGE